MKVVGELSGKARERMLLTGSSTGGRCGAVATCCGVVAFPSHSGGAGPELVLVMRSVH